MNNYQTQQFWNDINGIIGFTTSVLVLGFLVGMVKPMGKFFEPPRRPLKHPPKPIVKEVIVPGGSYWECVSCGKGLPSGTKVFKAGKEVYCSISCIKLLEYHSSPQVWIGVWYDTPADRRRIESAPGLLEYTGSIIQELIQKYGTAPIDLGFAEIKKEVLAIYVDHSIVLQPIVSEAWVVDRETTKKVLRYVVSHEFGHYLAEFVLTEEERKILGEEHADALAKRETSMTREEVNKMTDALGRKILTKLRIE